MGKFTRVSNIEETPSILNKFTSQDVQENDPYAHLLAGSRERQAQIARDTVDVKRERKALADNTHEWERVTTSEVYQQPKFNPLAENSRPMDAMGQIIRRVISGEAEDPNPRLAPEDFGLMDREGYEALLEARVATIHNPDVFSMQSALEASMQERGYFDETSKEEKRAKNLASWQTTAHQNVIRERKKVTARANPILLHKAGQSIIRTGMENITDSKFGLPDINSIIRHEQERANQRLAAKEARDQIKSNHILNSRERHDIWQNSVQQKAVRAQDQQASWLDSYADQLRED